MTSDLRPSSAELAVTCEDGERGKQPAAAIGIVDRSRAGEEARASAGLEEQAQGGGGG